MVGLQGVIVTTKTVKKDPGYCFRLPYKVRVHPLSWLHRQLAKRAELARTSLNQWAVSYLAEELRLEQKTAFN